MIVVMTMMEIIVIAIMLMMSSYSYGPSLGGKNGNLAGLGSKVKCIPFRPEQTLSRSILSFDHLFLKVMKSHLLLNKTQLHTCRGRACGRQLKQRFYEETFYYTPTCQNSTRNHSWEIQNCFWFALCSSE